MDIHLLSKQTEAPVREGNIKDISCMYFPYHVFPQFTVLLLFVPTFIPFILSPFSIGIPKHTEQARSCYHDTYPFLKCQDM